MVPKSIELTSNSARGPTRGAKLRVSERDAGIRIDSVGSMRRTSSSFARANLIRQENAKTGRESVLPHAFDEVVLQISDAELAMNHIAGRP